MEAKTIAILIMLATLLVLLVGVGWTSSKELWFSGSRPKKRTGSAD